MFESFYGMSHQPFAATPNPSCCAAVKSMKTAYDALNQCLVSGQGIGILTSSSGMGKSLLCQTLADSLTETFHTIYLPGSNYKSPRDLLQSILCHLEKPFKKLSVQELRLDITRALGSVLDKKESGTILFIEEAESLDPELLEEVRTLSNLMIQGKPLIQIILSGHMELEEVLISPSLSNFHQRIGCQVTLGSLTKQETIEYIELRIQWAGGKLDEVFTPSAIDFIAQVSDGNPRCINAICEHSLSHGAQIGEKPIDMNAVILAFEQLKQLPLRWNEPQIGISENSSNSSPNHVNQKSDFASEITEDEITEDSTELNQQADLVDNSSCIEIGADIEPSCSTPSCSTVESSIDEGSEMITFEVGAESEIITESSGRINDPIPEASEVLSTESKTDSNSHMTESGTETMIEKSEIVEADYCVPEGDGWTTFDPVNRQSPIEVIEQLESALSSISQNGNDESTVPETNYSVEAIAETDHFEEEVVIDPYAALDAHSSGQKQSPATVVTESFVVEAEMETISIQAENNLKISGSKIKESQAARLDPAEIRQAMKNDSFDVIIPDHGSQTEIPSAQINQPNFIGKKPYRQEI